MKTIILVLLFLSCSNDKTKVINASLESKVITIDPHKSYDLVSNTVVYQFYEALFQYHYLKRPYTIEPLLAQKLPTISDDGLTYTIHIKEKIPYHNWKLFSDTPRFVTSYDFINSIKRLAFKHTDSKGWWLLKNKIRGLDSFREKVGDNKNLLLSTNVEGLTPLSDHSFQIKLNEPYPQLLHVLTMAFTTPMPQEVTKNFNDKLESNEFGTGAYILKKFEPNKILVLESNPDYVSSLYPSTGDRLSNERKLLKWAKKKLPLNNKLIFKIIPDNEQSWKNFLNGDIDFLDIPSEMIDRAVNLRGALKKTIKEESITLEVSPSLVFWWLGLNMNDELIGKNKNLRKAIAYAINVKKYVSTFYPNVGRQANSIYPPGVPGHSPLKKWAYQYNVDLAKEFLEKAGYPNGKGLPIIEFNTRRTSERHVLMAKYIQNDLKKIGITSKIVVNDFSQFLNKAKKGEMQFWSSGWLLDYPDAQNILQLLYSKNGNGGPNKTSYNNKKFDKIYEQLLNEHSQEKHNKLLVQMEEIVSEDVPWILTNYSINYVVRHKEIQNLRYSDLIFNLYKYLDKK